MLHINAGPTALDENGVPETERQVFTVGPLVLGAAPKIWKFWARGLISKNETIDRMLDSGVTEEDAQALFAAKREEDYNAVMSKYLGLVPL